MPLLVNERSRGPRPKSRLQTTRPGDAWEQDAHARAQRALAMPAVERDRSCACGGGCPQCRHAAPDFARRSLPAGTDEGLNSSRGRALDAPIREFLEPRFDADLGAVRIHTGDVAAASAHALGASAYAVGKHVVFGASQYAPQTITGMRLLAHELAHVLQPQRPENLVARSGPGSTLGEMVEEKKRECLDLLDLLAREPGPPSSFTKGGCPSNFCQPFNDARIAKLDLEEAKPCLLAGIMVKVGYKAVPLWQTYLEGGSDLKDLSADFGAVFTASPTTLEAANYLVAEMRKDLGTRHALGRPLEPEVEGTYYKAAREAINTPGHPREMNFNVPQDIPGNLAGGIATDQLAVSIGARPSPVPDLRAANMHADISPHPDGSVTVTPNLSFVVQDTIDLCPGNCGTTDEQQATILLSRFEATGLTGDVPYVIRFDAPSAALTPFVIGAKKASTP